MYKKYLLYELTDAFATKRMAHTPSVRNNCKQTNRNTDSRLQVVP